MGNQKWERTKLVSIIVSQEYIIIKQIQNIYWNFQQKIVVNFDFANILSEQLFGDAEPGYRSIGASRSVGYSIYYHYDNRTGRIPTMGYDIIL